MHHLLKQVEKDVASNFGFTSIIFNTFRQLLLLLQKFVRCVYTTLFEVRVNWECFAFGGTILAEYPVLCTTQDVSQNLWRDIGSYSRKQTKFNPGLSLIVYIHQFCKNQTSSRIKFCKHQTLSRIKFCKHQTLSRIKFCKNQTSSSIKLSPLSRISCMIRGIL